MNLIEQLEELPQLLAGEGPFYDVCVKLSDVRAIIEQHKSDMGVNLQLQIAPTVLLSKDFFRLSKDEGVLIQSWLNSAYEQIDEQHKSEVEPVARVTALSNLGFSTMGQVEWIGNKYSLSPDALLYAAPQPDHTKLIGELVRALDRYSGCTGRLSDEINALLTKARESIK